jgi:hypothetical protein
MPLVDVTVKKLPGPPLMMALELLEEIAHSSWTVAVTVLKALSPWKEVPKLRSWTLSVLQRKNLVAERADEPFV